MTISLFFGTSSVSQVGRKKLNSKLDKKLTGCFMICLSSILKFLYFFLPATITFVECTVTDFNWY